MCAVCIQFEILFESKLNSNVGKNLGRSFNMHDSVKNIAVQIIIKKFSVYLAA